jgi:hypothetical protein
MLALPSILARLLLSCCFFVILMNSSAAISATPDTTVVTSGDKRAWLADRYAADARFALRAGNIVIWEPMDGLAPGALVEFAGVLDDEATTVLSELLRKDRIHTLSLAGPGGLVEPTLKLGRAVRQKGVTTLVETGRGCYSACALLFLAGERRITGQEPKYSYLAPAAVGFHAPYTVTRDGRVRHLQDVKTSSSCAYIKQMLPATSANELCAYTLATKGMATFSFEAGKKLHIYTHSESAVLLQWLDSVTATTTSDENKWIACERLRISQDGRDSRRGDDTYHSFPCLAELAPPSPTPHSRFEELAKVVRALGPSPLRTDIYESAKVAVADRLLLIGLNHDEQHYIACHRALMWLLQHNKRPDMTSQSFNTSAYTPEYQLYQRSCQYSALLPKGRRIEGIGVLSDHVIANVLDRMARNQGSTWPPPEQRR